jgi:hypothetical protein
MNKWGFLSTICDIEDSSGVAETLERNRERIMIGKPERGRVHDEVEATVLDLVSRLTDACPSATELVSKKARFALRSIQEKHLTHSIFNECSKHAASTSAGTQEENT